LGLKLLRNLTFILNKPSISRIGHQFHEEGIYSTNEVSIPQFKQKQKEPSWKLLQDGSFSVLPALEMPENP
jgi:hypothetical protein